MYASVAARLGRRRFVGGRRHGRKIATTRRTTPIRTLETAPSAIAAVNLAFLYTYPRLTASRRSVVIQRPRRSEELPRDAQGGSQFITSDEERGKRHSASLTQAQTPSVTALLSLPATAVRCFDLGSDVRYPLACGQGSSRPTGPGHASVASNDPHHRRPVDHSARRRAADRLDHEPWCRRRHQVETTLLVAGCQRSPSPHSPPTRASPASRNHLSSLLIDPSRVLLLFTLVRRSSAPPQGPLGQRVDSPEARLPSYRGVATGPGLTYTVTPRGGSRHRKGPRWAPAFKHTDQALRQPARYSRSPVAPREPGFAFTSRILVQANHAN